MLNSLTVIIPTIRNPEYTRIVIKSFERFKPAKLNIKYIIVENSPDDSFMKEAFTLAKNVKWIQNPIDMTRFPTNYAGSFANAAGVETGLKAVDVDEEWVFIAHSDVCVTSESFFKELSDKVDQGYVLVGTVRDNGRKEAIHVSGYLTTVAIANTVSFYPVIDFDGKMIADVGDGLNLYCEKYDQLSFCFKNTENGHTLTDEKYASLPVDRCMDSSGKVMFLHLGRGTPKGNVVMLDVKTAGMFGWVGYTKPGRTSKQQWISACEKIIGV